MITSKMSSDLVKHGVTVVPCLSPDLTQYCNSEVFNALKQFPEYKNHDREYVKGAFGALGNPASFHCPIVRSIRLKAMIEVAPVFAPLANGMNLCQLVDRLCIRRKGTAPGKESWHRDQSKLRDDKETVFGGWLNLDNQSQYFSCVPGTHTERSSQSGFLKLDGDYDSKKVLVEIPPGHVVIFYQHIVHEVLSKKSKIDSLRLFIGWCITPLTTSPIENLENLIKTQSVIPLSSGQIPPMYSPNHASFFAKDLEEWSKHMFHERCLNGSRVERYMRSLLEYGAMYEPYAPVELGILTPGRTWKIRLMNGKLIKIKI